MARASDNKLRLAWTAALPDHVISLSWSPDGKALAAAAVSGPVAILDASSGKTIHDLKGHGFGTAAVAWQPGGNLLASAGQDGKVRLWDTATGAEVKSLEAGGAWVERLAWNAAGTLLATSAGKTARVWQADGQFLRELPPQAGTITDLAWRPGTDHLAVLAYGAAMLYDPATGELLRTFAWKGSPLAMAWSPDAKVLAHGNQDATVHFWYFESGVDLQMHGYPAKVRELSWDFSSRYLATGGGPMPCIWDCGGPKGPEGTKPQMLEGHEETLTAVAFQGRGYLLASSAMDGRVILWQPGNKKAPKIGEHRFGAEASTIAWSPEDRMLSAGAGDGTTALFRVG
jgi:WD40 repeat protein